MTPNEHVIPTYDFRLNRKGELIAVSSIGKEKETIERHIQLFELGVSSKTQIFVNDAIERPNKAETMLTFEAVGL